MHAEDPNPSTHAPAPGSARLDAIDALRGLVMVVMALDHVRDYVSNSQVSPESLASPALFFTRWLTHFCAPVFVLLAGAGAFLYGSRGRSRAQLRGFLLSRGIWLVALELTVVRWGWNFNFDFDFMVGQVIWAIGWSMMALAALIHLPTRWITAFGVAMIIGHNTLDGLAIKEGGWAQSLWSILHTGDQIKITDTWTFFPLYPLIPWIGVMATGYGLGELYTGSPERRRALLLRLGGAMIVAFFALRLPNLYGEARSWEPGGSFVHGVMSVLNCSKYPPSLLYLLMTLGPSLVALGLAENRPHWTPRWLVIFGQVPLFYYLIHLYLIHWVAGVVALLQGHADQARWIWSHAFFANRFEGFGLSLPGVYLVWALVVAMLYPACRWYAGVKRRARHPLLSYL